jgi:2-methylcitrate dehydratase PrpD
MNNVTEQIVSFAADLQIDQVPLSVQKSAKLSMLDGLGTGLLCSGNQKSRQIAKALIPVSHGTSTVWGRREKASLLAATIINGTFVEGLGYSDIHVRAQLHPTGVILPAVLTYGERSRNSGEEVLTAFSLGCEVMVRLGLSAPGRFHTSGFQPTSAIGGLGAALAVGKLAGLDLDGLENALSIASTFSFGSSLSVRAGAYFGGPDPGRAAESGVLASLLAKSGVKGIAPDSIEGRYGFLETHAGSGNYDPRPVISGLSRRWEMANIFVKRYPTSYSCTNVLDAAVRLRRTVGRDLRAIRAVRFGESAHNIDLFCNPERQKRSPDSLYAAETSYYFLVAAALKYGEVTVQTLDKFREKSVLTLAGKVEAVRDEKSRWVEVELKDGTILKEVQDELIQTTEERLRRKFYENSSPIVGPERAAEIEEAVDSLENLKDVRDLTRLLVRKKLRPEQLSDHLKSLHKD